MSASPAAGKYVIAILRKEIPVCGAGESSAGRPTSAAQYLAFAKPRLRIVFIRIGSKTWKRHEVRRRPFPNIADRLPAAEGAVAPGAGCDIERSVKSKIQICILVRRRGTTPRPGTLHRGQTPAVGAWLADCCRFPLCLCGQPTLRPAAPGLGFVPVDENNRSVGRNDLDAVVAAPCPHTVRFRLPVNGTLGAQTLAPRPSGIAPEFPNTITASLNKICKFPIGDRRARDKERDKFNLVRPFFVIKNEPVSAR